MAEYQESIVNQLNLTVQNTVDSIKASMSSYQILMENMTESAMVENAKLIKESIDDFRQSLIEIRNSRSGGDDAVSSCIEDEGSLDVLEEQINEEVKTCTTTIMQEVVNVISDSLNQAQTFMTIPEVIGKDIQKCGLSASCMKTIVGDAISESLQVPPKVFTISARIQSMNLRTVVSIDACIFNAIKKVTKMGMNILEDVFYCIDDEINGE